MDAVDSDEHHLLRPGAPVLRRDATTVQVGLDHPGRVVLPDCTGVRSLLAALRDGVGLRRPAAREEAALWWSRLLAAGLLVPSAGPSGLSGTALAAARAWAGADAGRRLGARRALEVAVLGSGEPAGALARLLRTGGVRLVEACAAVGRPPAQEDLSLAVLVFDGEARRDVVDPWLARGTPHLLLWARGGLPRVGPLVVPGVTACLRCLDAHDAEQDPRRALLVEQAIDQPPPTGDPVLLALAAAWAARDVLRYAEGEAPSTWSATLTVGPTAAPTARALARHAHCGCAWDVDLGVTA